MAAAVVPGGAQPGDVLDAVSELVDASLLVVDTSGPDTRYRMLETVRAVALARLEADGRLVAARDRFVDHVHGLVMEVLEAGAERWPAAVLHRLLDEFDNIAAALRACIAHDDRPDRALPLFTVLWGVIHQAHVDDVADLGRHLRARWPDAAAPHADDAIAVLASAVLLLGQVDEAVAIASAPTSRPAAAVYAPALVPRVLGLAAWYRGDLDLAVGCLDEAVAAARARGRLAVGMECEVFGALVRADAGAHDEALAIVRDVARRAGATGSTLNELWALTAEGAITAARDPTAARPGVERTLAAAEAADYPFGITSNLQTLARCLVRTGAVAEAATATLRLLNQAGRSGRGDLRVALVLSAEVAAAGGRPEAGVLAATAASLPDTSPMRTGATLGARTTGRALPVPEATRLARRLLATIAEEATVAGDTDLRPVAVSDGDGECAEFRLVGEVWHVRFAGTAVEVTASKGMADLARLLARPGQEVHCIELTGAAVEQATTGGVIDATARRRYEARVRELQAEIDEAEELHDAGRAERAKVELDVLVDHLTAALGRSGRTREGVGTAERARSAVAHRIRATIRRLGGLHPALGRHLEVSVSTGHYCSYRPECPVDWRT